MFGFVSVPVIRLEPNANTLPEPIPNRISDAVDFVIIGLSDGNTFGFKAFTKS